MKIDTFSNRLKIAIVKKGMRQIELSEKTHIPKSAINQYLRGRFEPKQDRLSDIASVLEVSEAWLMGFDVPMQEPADKNETTVTAEDLAEINELYEIYSSLPEEQQQIVTDLIRSLSKNHSDNNTTDNK